VDWQERKVNLVIPGSLDLLERQVLPETPDSLDQGVYSETLDRLVSLDSLALEVCLHTTCCMHCWTLLYS